MSQQQVAAYPQPQPQYIMVPMRESNGLGVAGFFIALIGLAIPTGIIALLGMLVSLVALGKAPRGFAGMGVVVGLFGTVLWLAITGIAILGAVAVGQPCRFRGHSIVYLSTPPAREPAPWLATLKSSGACGRGISRPLAASRPTSSPMD